MKKFIGVLVVVSIIVGCFILLKKDVNVRDDVVAYLSSGKHIEKVEDGLDKYRNHSDEIDAIQSESLGIINKELDKLVVGEFKSLEEFENVSGSMYERINSLLNINIVNDSGINVSLLSEDDTVEVLNTFTNLNTEYIIYFEALDLESSGDYIGALSVLHKEKTFLLGDKTTELHESLENQVNEMIVKHVNDIDDGNSDSKIVKYLSGMRVDLTYLVSDMTVIDELIIKYNDGVYYDVSAFKKISVDKMLNNIKSNKKTVYFIGKEGCVYCRNFVPTLTKVAKDLDLTIYYVDADTIDYTTKSYDTLYGLGKEYMSGYPSFMVFEAGDVIGGSMGAKGYDSVISFLSNLGIE